MLTRRRFAALSAAVAGATLAAPLKARASATRSGMEFGVQILWSATGSGPLICPPRFALFTALATPPSRPIRWSTTVPQRS